MRHDLYLFLALVLVAMALVIPRLLRGDWLGALLSLLSLAGLVLAVIGILVASQWLHGKSDGTGLGHKLSMAVGILLRFGLFGFIGAAIAAGLAANHHLGVQGENWVGGVAGGLTGFLGTGLYYRLGKARFWPLFGWFALSLLGSFMGGILGILGPEPWSIDAGILIPLVLFLILALSGRVQAREGEDEEPLDGGNQP